MNKRLSSKIASAILVLACIFLSSCAVSADSDSARREFFERIANEKDFGGYKLDIEIRGSHLIARGTVSNESAQARVREIAQSLEGIRRVTNDVVIATPASTESFAAQTMRLITERAKRELPKDNFSLQLSTVARDLILSGSVDSVRGSRAIVKIAEEVAPGMVVRNQLVVREEVLTDEELRNRVIKALSLDPQNRLDDLTIRAENGEISIAGVRPDHRAIDRLLSTIIMVEGVTDVKSSIEIRP